MIARRLAVSIVKSSAIGFGHINISRCCINETVVRSQYGSMRYFSHDENSGTSILEVEKELFVIKRNMMKTYASGQDYPSALAFAIELSEKVANSKEMGGKETTIYASCLNNVALMVACFFI